jgi:hypothetical protein
MFDRIANPQITGPLSVVEVVPDTREIQPPEIGIASRLRARTDTWLLNEKTQRLLKVNDAAGLFFAHQQAARSIWSTARGVTTAASTRAEVTGALRQEGAKRAYAARWTC